jgi:membrane-associated protein
VLAGEFGYYLGTKISRDKLQNNKIYKIKDEHLNRTEKFFEKYGALAIILSRFVPIIRNFISQVLGTLHYDRKKFFIYNILASLIWPFFVTFLGFSLGSIFPNLIVYAEYLLLAVFGILMLPILLEFFKKR